jgi:cytochrome c-type biogenesis protein
VVSGSLSAGFMSVFVVAGSDLVPLHELDQPERQVRHGGDRVGLITLGHRDAARFQAADQHASHRRRWPHTRVGSMFVFGIAYAVASIGCTIGLFLATLFSTRRDGIASGVANVAAYGAGMALLVTALTVALAVANTGLLRVLRGGMRTSRPSPRCS